ncbi:MAG: hypothetical protein ACLSD6_07345 [Clostridium sp.]
MGGDFTDAVKADYLLAGCARMYERGLSVGFYFCMPKACEEEAENYMNWHLLCRVWSGQFQIL